MSFITRAVSKITSVFAMQTRSAKSTLNAILEARESTRIAQNEIYWDMYNGRHWDYEREDGELPYVNYCYAFVEKQIDWLVGRTPEFHAGRDIQPVIKHLYKEIIDNSGGPQILREICQMGGITGDVLVRIGWDDDVNYGKGGIALKVMDSNRSFWEYTNQGQTRQLSKVLVIWDELFSNGEIGTRAQLWTSESIRNYGYIGDVGAERTFQNQHNIESLEEGKNVFNDSYGNYIQQPNPFGFIPYVHIFNLEVSQDTHGRSDLHDIWVLNKELNSALLSYKDNVDYHGNPLTLLFGISLKNVEKGANKVWGNLPKDGRVQNLEVTQTFEMTKQYISYMREFMSLEGNVPQQALGGTQAISNTSGTALQMMFLPLTEIVNRKRLTYGRGFREIMEIALQMTNSENKLGLEVLTAPEESIIKARIEIADSDKANKKSILDVLDRVAKIRERPYYATEVIFKDPFPKDATAFLSNAEIKLRNKLDTRAAIMKEMGVQDVKEKQEDIRQEALEGAELLRKTTELSGQDAQSDLVEGAKPRETPSEVEQRTGQPDDNVAIKRATKGKA